MTAPLLGLLRAPPPQRCFTGKGGVGKTSLACAAAIALADAGKRVLFVSPDPASNLDEMFGQALTDTPRPILDVPGLCHECRPSGRCRGLSLSRPRNLHLTFPKWSAPRCVSSSPALAPQRSLRLTSLRAWLLAGLRDSTTSSLTPPRQAIPCDCSACRRHRLVSLPTMIVAPPVSAPIPD